MKSSRENSSLVSWCRVFPWELSWYKSLTSLYRHHFLWLSSRHSLFMQRELRPNLFLLLINISETTLILSLPFQRQTVSVCNMSCFTCTLLSLQLFLSCMTVTRISIWCHIDNHNVLCSDVVRSHDLDWLINKCFSQRCFVCLLFPIRGFPFLSVSSTHLSAGDAD